MTKVFIDGRQGTTGLKIYNRFNNRDDIELLIIDEDKRKDINERKRLINESDVTFLCLPDQASIEAVSLVENENVKIIDDYNQTVINRINYVSNLLNIDIKKFAPCDKKGIPHMLGLFELEKEDYQKSNIEYKEKEKFKKLKIK